MRKHRLAFVAAAVPLLITLGVLLALLGGRAEGMAARRSFELTYQVHLPEIPGGARQLQLWVPLAVSDEHQTIRQRSIQSPVPYRITQDPDYGNDILFVDLQSPLPQDLALSIQYQAEVQGRQAQLSRAAPELSDLPPGMARHLLSNRHMVVNEQIRELAGAVTAGAATPLERSQRIYHYVVERMTYEKETPGWGRGDTLRACEIGAGNCTDFHSLFISLARASGIPARFQIGIPVPEKPEGEIPGYHCWAQFYLPEAGWIPVDASEAWKDPRKYDYFFGTYDPNRLALSLGRDIRLVPQPASPDPVNIFFYPYVEVDGKSLENEKIQTRFHFRDLAVG